MIYFEGNLSAKSIPPQYSLTKPIQFAYLRFYYNDLLVLTEEPPAKGDELRVHPVLHLAGQPVNWLAGGLSTMALYFILYFIAI